MAETADRDEKTEDPTDRRREETRERGSVARSNDLSAAALALASTGAMYFQGSAIHVALASILRDSLSMPPLERIDTTSLMLHVWKLAATVGAAVVPLFGLIVVCVAGVGFLQVGFRISPMAIQPELSRINPASGWQRIFSLQGAVKVAVNSLKLAILGTVAWSFISSRLPLFLSGPNLHVIQLGSLLGDSLLGLAFQLSLALAAIAAIDYGYQLWNFEQSLKMSKQELREEVRMMDGDPQTRQMRREAHRKLADAKQIRRAAEASVLITNPTEFAVAIKYEGRSDREVPIVVAKGAGLLAARLRRLAAENGIPIVEKKPLARALYATVKVGQPIPEELYAAVAEILAYVMRLKKTAR